MKNKQLKSTLVRVIAIGRATVVRSIACINSNTFAPWNNPMGAEHAPFWGILAELPRVFSSIIGHMPVSMKLKLASV
ncbi:hypothetical protein [Rubidibacter lacunae]|uniref:hypothetical protein n=1 Tax=Rubidibacter lacunae TaxID=582514 RepID=UPI0012EC62B6|nr:hypothetical protein [Rubidibacter lacunae]